MGDATTSDLVTFAELARAMPPARPGRAVTMATIYRMHREGLIRAQKYRVGKGFRYYVTREEFERLTSTEPSGGGRVTMTRTLSQRERAAEAAQRRLEQIRYED